MRETRTSGSVRGAPGDGRPYRERILVVAEPVDNRPDLCRVSDTGPLMIYPQC